MSGAALCTTKAQRCSASDLEVAFHLTPPRHAVFLLWRARFIGAVEHRLLSAATATSSRRIHFS